MAGTSGIEDLIAHLERTTRLERGEAERVVGEMLAYFSESPEQFVTRRHGELQAESQKNDAIFRQIATEMSQRRFTCPNLTARQLRRLIYG